MIERLFAAFGVDYPQWRALTLAYLRMDLRRGGGPRRPDDKRRPVILAYGGLLLVTLLQGALLTAIAFALEDTFTATVLLTTFAGMNTGMLVMADFAAFVVSPDDYWVIGSRPVSERTYFAARLASILVYLAAIASTMSIMPAIALGWWHGLGMIGGLTAFLAAVLCSASAAIVTIALYAALTTRVGVQRLSRVVGYLQLAASTFFFGGYYFVMRALEEARVRQLSVRDVDWIWLVPSTWFAALVPAVSGRAGTREWIAVAAAVTLTAACAPLAGGRLTLDYAEHLSKTSTAAAARPRRRSGRRLPGFGRGEAYAIATLIRAQFRHDMRFRMAILTILPLTAFYVLLGGSGSLSDPFVAGAARPNVPLYFAVVFMPMTLHGALRLSDSWRASWIFFATPADPARLIVAAKNFVAVFFLGGYVLLLATFASFYYERVWHAFLHMGIVGGIAHLLLQGAVTLAPHLPFASEPRKAERSSALFGLFFFGSVAGTAIPMLLPFVYRSALATAVLLALLIGLTAGLERALRARARAAVLATELSS